MNEKNKEKTKVKEGPRSEAEAGQAPGQGQQQLEHVVTVPGHAPESTVIGGLFEKWGKRAIFIELTN